MVSHRGIVIKVELDNAGCLSVLEGPVCPWWFPDVHMLLEYITLVDKWTVDVHMFQDQYILHGVRQHHAQGHHVDHRVDLNLRS